MRLTSALQPNLPFGLSRRASGILVALAIGALVGLVFWNIQHTAVTTRPGLPLDIWHLLRMTSIQAGLSTLLSLSVGMALAWSLNRLFFVGRGIVTGLFATAIVTPGLVIAIGLLTVWGRAGWINSALAPIGIDLQSSIFGLHGILAAHVILNGAFAANILLARLEAIPQRKLKIGQSLSLGPARRFAILDWPAMSGALPGLAAIIFLLAFTSFPIVLILGGGPSNQTLEVAIYSYVRLNFDLNSAVQLASVQLAVCMAIILPAISYMPAIADAGSTKPSKWSDPPLTRALQGAILIVGVAGFLLPLLGVLIDGMGPNLFALMARSSFWNAVWTSLIIGFSSALLVLVLALALAFARAETKNRFWRVLFNLPVYAYLIVPAVVLSLGLFLGIRNLAIAPAQAAPFVLIIANALLALPFAISTLGPQIDAINQRYSRLVRMLNLTGLTRWKLVEWPLLGREIGITLALGFCFSLGDLGVISLFGTQDFSTLPWLMLRAMGAYRTGDAAAIAALLLILALVIFWSLPRLFMRLSNAQNH